MSKHNWSEKEDKICCKFYYNYFVKKNSCLKVDEFVTILKKKLVAIEENSIKMKLQNIKYFLQRSNVKDYLDIAPLPHNSAQTEKIMTTILQKGNYKAKYATIVLALIILISYFIFIRK